VSGARQRSGGVEKYSWIASRQAPEHGYGREHCSRANIFVLMFILRGRIALWNGRPTVVIIPLSSG
jgi:hypothetical protein